MYIFLYTIFFIIFISFLFYFFYTSDSQSVKEHFNNNSSYYTITQSFVDDFDIDNYIILDDKNKEIYKIDGKWNLDIFYLYLQKDNTKIPIKKIDGTYQFTSNKINTKIIYKPSDENDNIIGQLILNNYEDELNIYKEDNNYIYKSGEKVVAKVERIESKKDKNKFKLDIVDIKYNKFLDSFIVSFIIFNHIEKQLNFSHDK